MFKSIGPVEFTTIYFGGGPVEKYQIHGNTWTTDWATGQPKLDADYIVCTHIQVVYAGVNLTSPDACAQTTTLTQRGRPSNRSPAMVSRICSVPPAIVRQRVLRKS